MKTTLLGLIVAGPLLSTAAVAAENPGSGSAERPGASEYAPGDRMQPGGEEATPGAFEYSPGKEPDPQSPSTGQGVSEYAPGQQLKAAGSASSSSSSE
jgi:hypothetical protein